MDLADLLNMSKADEPPAARPDMRAQRLELMDRWAQAQLPSDVQPGDLVVGKHGMGPLCGGREGIVALILWSLLDWNDPIDQVLIKAAIKKGATARPDCIVALIDDDGTLKTTFAERNQFRALSHDEHQAMSGLLGAHDAAEPGFAIRAGAAP